MATYASVTSDAHPFADPIIALRSMKAVTAPDVLFLEFVCSVVLLTKGKGGHKHPFGNGGPVYATARRYINFGVNYDGMFGQMIYASGPEMDESESRVKAR